MSCAGEGATHHAACDCREAAHRAEVSQLRDKLADAEKDRDWAYGEFEAYGSPFELRDRAEKAEAEVERLRSAATRLLGALDGVAWQSCTEEWTLAHGMLIDAMNDGDRSTSAKTDPQK